MPQSKTPGGVPLKAPNGRYRVILVDNFNNTDRHCGDYPTLKGAKRVAQGKVKSDLLTKAHVYDQAGRHIFEAGHFLN